MCLIALEGIRQVRMQRLGQVIEREPGYLVHFVRFPVLYLRWVDEDFINDTDPMRRDAVVFTENVVHTEKLVPERIDAIFFLELLK